jgi:glycosyltransferase involved in cell wall biosynthesis
MATTARAPRSTTSAGEDMHGRVLVIVENVPAAIDTRLRKQIDSLLASGHTLSIVSRRDPSNDRYRSDPRIRVYEYPSLPEPSGLLGYAVEYAASFLAASILSVRALTQERVDVVQFCQPPDIYFPLAGILRALGYGILLDQRDLLPELFVARYGRADRRILGVLRLLERLSYRSAHRVLVVNDYLKGRALEHGVASERVTIVRNGPALTRVERAQPDPSLKGGYTFLCCWAGKMGRQDRLDVLLRAISTYVHDLGRTDCRFAILGDGECFEETTRSAQELGIDPYVTFTDWISEPEVFTYLATADLGLDSSLQEEVSPVKALEYMAHGLPFVAFDLLETRSIAEGAAAFVPPEDVDGLARAIDDLLHDPARRASLGRTGRERVREQLAWERQARGYLAVVLDLTRRRPARRRWVRPRS